MSVSSYHKCGGAVHMMALALIGALLGCTAQGEKAKIQVVSGVTVQHEGAEEHPYMASIFKSDSHHCSGVLIKHNVVLTAAHCVDPRTTNPSQLKVRFFRTDGQETIYISEIKVHPGYQGRGGGSNIALLKMAWPPSQANGVQSLGGERLELNYNEKLLFLGWGRTSDSSQFSPQLQKTYLPVLELDNCSAKIGRRVSPREFCAGAEGKGPCSGDDGGPLLRLGSSPESDALIGIATSQLACGATEKPDIFTRISTYKFWLMSELEKL